MGAEAISTPNAKATWKLKIHDAAAATTTKTSLSLSPSLFLSLSLSLSIYLSIYLIIIIIIGYNTLKTKVLGVVLRARLW